MVVETYSEEAAHFDQFGHGLSEKSDRKLSDLVAPKPGDKCLDVATGTGNLALALSSRVGNEGKVIAIDLAEGMLEFAQRKARARKVKNIEFKRMDAGHLEFEDNTFDAITCGLAIFYFPDIEGTLKEMCRVLKPGGTLGLSTADPETAFSPLSETYMKRLRTTAEVLDISPPGYSELAAMTRNKSGLETLLKDAGYEDIKIQEDSIPVNFTSPEDWWNHGRGSTWGELLLKEMLENERDELEAAHLKEIKPLFSEDGVKTATPVIFAIAHKPE
jgi:ubiquinone/menaquinone biosynthesis C-methylase UbiE